MSYVAGIVVMLRIACAFLILSHVSHWIAVSVIQEVLTTSHFISMSGVGIVSLGSPDIGTPGEV